MSGFWVSVIAGREEVGLTIWSVFLTGRQCGLCIDVCTAQSHVNIIDKGQAHRLA